MMTKVKDIAHKLVVQTETGNIYQTLDAVQNCTTAQDGDIMICYHRLAEEHIFVCNVDEFLYKFTIISEIDSKKIMDSRPKARYRFTDTKIQDKFAKAIAETDGFDTIAADEFNKILKDYKNYDAIEENCKEKIDDEEKRNDC